MFRLLEMRYWLLPIATSHAKSALIGQNASATRRLLDGGCAYPHQKDASAVAVLKNPVSYSSLWKTHSLPFPLIAWPLAEMYSGDFLLADSAIKDVSAALATSGRRT